MFSYFFPRLVSFSSSCFFQCDSLPIFVALPSVFIPPPFTLSHTQHPHPPSSQTNFILIISHSLSPLPFFSFCNKITFRIASFITKSVEQQERSRVKKREHIPCGM